MKYIVILTLILSSCTHDKAHVKSPIGTWKLVTGMTIAKGDTVITDYTKGQEMIKIITPSHFAFMRHDLNNGKDSTAVFVAGGGRCTIDKNVYIEYLDYCNYREWEDGKFEFEYTISNDTLKLSGIEKVEKLNVEHLNVETFVKEKQELQLK